MNLLYLPTLIALAIKYGPDVIAAGKLIEQYSPLALKLIKAIAPIIHDQFGGLKLTSTTDIVEGVQQVLVDLGHRPLGKDETDVLTNRLSAMS